MSAANVVYPQAANLANDDPRVVEIRQGQDTLFAARRKVYAGEVSVLEQTVAQLEAQIEGLQSVIRSEPLDQCDIFPSPATVLRHYERRIDHNADLQSDLMGFLPGIVRIPWQIARGERSNRCNEQRESEPARHPMLHSPKLR